MLISRLSWWWNSRSGFFNKRPPLLSELDMLVNSFIDKPIMSDRIDIAIKIFETKTNVGAVLTESQVRAVEALKLKAKHFLMLAFDCGKEVEAPILARKKAREIDPYYIPGQLPAKLSPINPEKYADRNQFIRHRVGAHLSLLFSNKNVRLRQSYYKNEVVNKKENNVSYFSMEKRSKYLVSIENGALFSVKKSGWGIFKKLEKTRIHTSHMTSELGQGWAGFVVNQRGEFYLRELVPGKVHHSSFMQGGPVMMAGLIRVNRGIIEQINLSSGHYKPGNHNMKTCLDYFVQRNVNLEHCSVGRLSGNRQDKNLEDIDAMTVYKPFRV